MKYIIPGLLIIIGLSLLSTSAIRGLLTIGCGVILLPQLTGKVMNQLGPKRKKRHYYANFITFGLLFALIGALQTPGLDTRSSNTEIEVAEDVQKIVEIGSLLGKSSEDLSITLGQGDDFIPTKEQTDLSIGASTTWSLTGGYSLYAEYDNKTDPISTLSVSSSDGSKLHNESTWKNLFDLGTIEKQNVYYIKSMTEDGKYTGVEVGAGANERNKRKKIKEERFSAWDGSHKELTKVIKENMNDPSSYEHVNTNYVFDGGFVIITTNFRGNNAFGGKVLQEIIAKYDLDGNLIEIQE